MVELEYVKRIRRRKIAALLATLCSIVLTALIIVAFLGSLVGSFTVKIQNNDVKLALSSKSDLSDSSTYMMVNNLPSFELNTNSELQDHDRIDNPNTSYLDDGCLKDPNTGEVTALYFLKQTFYVTNIGTIPARYEFKITITENNKPGNVAYGYDDLLRVRLYENPKDSEEHNYETFAKRVRDGEASAQDEDGNWIYQEYVSVVPSDPDYHKFCTNFENQSTIVTKSVKGFGIGDSTRYTVLLWLEGYDNEAERNKDVVPEGGSIKLEVNVTGYEA